MRAVYFERFHAHPFEGSDMMLKSGRISGELSMYKQPSNLNGRELGEINEKISYLDPLQK